MNSKSQNKFYKILDPRLCSSPLGPVVLAPDVEHKHAGDEEEGHDQNWDWANLKIKKVFDLLQVKSEGQTM